MNLGVCYLIFKYRLPGIDDFFYFLKAMIKSFMDVYQIASSRIDMLMRKIASHQLQTTGLKSKLQTACLHETESIQLVSLLFK